MKKKPNILLILADDMGFSDLGCYGSKIETPNLDSLAEEGWRFSQFYTCAKCSPSRATLLTGLYPHQAGMGLLAHSPGVEAMKETMEEPPDGYIGDLRENCVTIAEILKEHGYGTYISGKWHLSNSVHEQDETWPQNRGFDRHYGNMSGATSYFYPQTMFFDGDNVKEAAKEDPDFYYTDKISQRACEFIKSHRKKDKEENQEHPFFLYVSYTCPHWPLHAREEDIEKYKGKFDEGWDKLREKRLENLRNMGLMNPEWELSTKGVREPPWDMVVGGDEEYEKWLLRRMEVYAAMIDRMDQGIGTVISKLKEEGLYEDTIILFLSDNGGCSEEIGDQSKKWISEGVAPRTCREGSEIHFGNNDSIMPGPESTWQSYGLPWANLSNSPFRGYKSQIYEGGISSPLIIKWKEGFEKAKGISHQQCHLIDIVPTLLDIVGIKAPKEYQGKEMQEMEGTSFAEIFKGKESILNKVLGWEHQGSEGIRENKWKLVKVFKRPWELYDMEQDRTETNDLIRKQKERALKMEKMYHNWAKRCNVLPYEEVQDMKREARKILREKR